MNVMMMSSLNTYTKNMKMQMKWKERQSSGNYSNHSVSSSASKASSLKENKSPEEAMLDSLKQDASNTMDQQIRAKMMSGKRLNSKEMEYLKENDPQTYQKAKEIEMEREAYERELKQCKTKEEVQRVKLSHAAAAMASVKEIESNPNIPKGEKLARMMQELSKINAAGDVERAYTMSRDYKSLPTEAERQKAEEELEKAKQEEVGIDDKTDDSVEEVTDSVNREAVSDALEEDITEDPPTDAEVEAAKKVVSGQQKSRMEAEVTPEARKVRRAKAQAAYAQTSYTVSTTHVVDVKVE